MECPKCHKTISDDSVVCPHCHKVLALTCPNCKNQSKTQVCDKCGHIILTKCNKCGNTISTSSKSCPKCGFPTSKSIAYQECEIDEFASLIIDVKVSKNDKYKLDSDFFFKLKNLLSSYLNKAEGCKIFANGTYFVNMNQELSLQTSAYKAVKLAIRIANGFSALSNKLKEEFKIPLSLNITVIKKYAENLLLQERFDNNVQTLKINKSKRQRIDGIQIVLDQYISDIVSEDYRTDSLFTVVNKGKSLMFYELMLEKYIEPDTRAKLEFQIKKERDIPLAKNKKVFDISAKCSFKKISSNSLISNIQDKKIISVISTKENAVTTSDLVKFYENKGKKVLRCVCSEETNYRSWGIFEQIVREYYDLPNQNIFLAEEAISKLPRSLQGFILRNPKKTSSPDDARFANMEIFVKFLKAISNCVVLIEDFEFIDDTSLQTLKLYFDKFKQINTPFVFTTTAEKSLHSRFKELLRTSEYIEYTLEASPLETLISDIKEDAEELISSAYYQSLNNSALYFKNALKYLEDKGVLSREENKLVINKEKQAVLPCSLEELIQARLKHFSKNQNVSLILAYSLYLGSRLEIELLETLGVQDINESLNTLEKAGFVTVKSKIIYINNYSLIKPIIQSALKSEFEEFLCKTILAKFAGKLDGVDTIFLLGKLSMINEEYLLLWKNAKYSLKLGDFDAYLKNCTGLLDLSEHIQKDIPTEEIENSKQEIFNNITLTLYGYSPEKIYHIEALLLENAIKNEDDKQIMKLSNLMLQGSLLSANYKDCQKLLNNIFSRMENPQLIVDGAINTRFLLLDLVNIEILFNIGDYAQCTQIANDLLGILKPDILDKIRPASFSLGSFRNHLADSFILVSFAKLFMMDDDLENFFNTVKNAIGVELSEKDCIISIKNYLRGKEFALSNTENATPLSKAIYLILQEFTHNRYNTKTFAEHIFQAKLLASDIHQKQLEMLCELLIAESYFKEGIVEKANQIYKDILELSESKGLFNTALLAKYFIAKMKIQENKTEEALVMVNEVLSALQNQDKPSQIHYVLFEKLLVETVSSYNISSINIESEARKLQELNSDNRFAGILN